MSGIFMRGVQQSDKSTLLLYQVHYRCCNCFSSTSFSQTEKRFFRRSVSLSQSSFSNCSLLRQRWWKSCRISQLLWRSPSYRAMSSSLGSEKDTAAEGEGKGKGSEEMPKTASNKKTHETEEEDEPKVHFSELRRLIEAEQTKRESTFEYGWNHTIVTLSILFIAVVVMLKMRWEKEYGSEQLGPRPQAKALIGGPWTLVNAHTGKTESSSDYHGKWLLIYFGFTNCPDICPEEMEKLCQVADIIEADKGKEANFLPIFFSVDPARDSSERVTKYCEEFSKKLIGFTGTKEQTDAVARTFRVYHSEGPKVGDDYIVDHSVVSYLVNPEGEFSNFYGQDRNATQVAAAVELEMFKYERKMNK